MKTREKILVGAKEYLLENGQAGFTIRSIADRAGVNKGLVHHYFGSKENLVLELIDYVADAPFKEIKRQAVNKTQEQVKEMISGILLGNTELVNMIFEFIYFARHSEKIKEKLRTVAKERREFIASCLEVDDPQIKYTLNAGVFGIILLSRIERDIDVKAALSLLFRQFNIM